MSENFITKEESVEITGKLIEKLLPTFKELAKHEAEHGFWLPEKYQSNPVGWLEAIREVEEGFKEYIKNKQ